MIKIDTHELNKKWVVNPKTYCPLTLPEQILPYRSKPHLTRSYLNKPNHMEINYNIK